jgi:cytochrome c oxidase cbb3-type subunit IV
MILLFVGIIFFAVRPKNKERFDEAAQIPLQDDDDLGDK